MSANPEVEGIIELPTPEAPVLEPQPEAQAEPAAPVAKARRVKPAWLGTAVLGAAALLATGTLGYVANAAAQQRNQAYSAFVSTKATLVSTNTALTQDRNDDLAVIHVSERLTPLTTISMRPEVGTSVMAVGSPLGLGGTISVGVVSGYRSIDGSDWMQFSAPISPGNSGGPVVDEHGRVLAVASAKLIGTGVEALSLGIPVQVACSALVVCDLSRQ